MKVCRSTVAFITGVLLTSVLVASCGRDEKNRETSSDSHQGETDPGETDQGTSEPLIPEFAVTGENRHSARLRGYEQINRILKARLLTEESEFFLASYLGGFHPDFPGDLVRLLGFRVSNGLIMEFQGSSPNPVNMLLWHIALGGFAADVATTCHDADRLQPLPSSLQQNFADIILKLCQWPAPEGRNEEVLGDLWLSFMGLDAPETEHEPFKTFFLGDQFAQATGEEMVVATLTAMSLNPYFLLKL